MSKTPGGVAVIGHYLHFIDTSGNERTYLGTDLGFKLNAQQRSIWVESEHVCYIDTSGHKRQCAREQIIQQASGNGIEPLGGGPVEINFELESFQPPSGLIADFFIGIEHVGAPIWGSVWVEGNEIHFIDEALEKIKIPNAVLVT